MKPQVGDFADDLIPYAPLAGHGHFRGLFTHLAENLVEPLLVKGGDIGFFRGVVFAILDHLVNGIKYVVIALVCHNCLLV